MKWYPVNPLSHGAARSFAEKVVKQSNQSGMKPRLGGTILEHMQGKLAEIIFRKVLRKKRIEFKCNAIRKDYSRLSSIDADFTIYGRIYPRLDVELKSRRNKNRSRSLPFLYPASQLQQKNYDYVVFIEFNQALTLYRFAGFIETEKIAEFDVREDLELPAHVIPFSALRPISEFWGLLS